MGSARSSPEWHLRDPTSYTHTHTYTHPNLAPSAQSPSPMHPNPIPSDCHAHPSVRQASPRVVMSGNKKSSHSRCPNGFNAAVHELVNVDGLKCTYEIRWGNPSRVRVTPAAVISEGAGDDFFFASKCRWMMCMHVWLVGMHACMQVDDRRYATSFQGCVTGDSLCRGEFAPPHSCSLTVQTTSTPVHHARRVDSIHTV